MVPKFDIAILSAAAVLVFGPGNHVTRALEPVKGKPTVAEYGHALRLLTALQATQPKAWARLSDFYGQLREAAGKAALRMPPAGRG